MKPSEIDEVHELKQRIKYWEHRANLSTASSEYYQAELTKAHALLGRVIHQMSERWDSVNLTKYFPTDNLHHKRGIGNPKGGMPKEPK